MATPFQRGNVCEDPERCETLEKKGGDPSESICPKCPVYMECQERGYLSQPAILQRAKAQLSGEPQLFFNPRHGAEVEEMLGQADETDRLCIIDEVETHELFVECSVPKTVENIQAFPTVYPNPNWTLWHHLKHFFAYYKWDDDAPMMWHNKVLRFWVPPVLHPNVKRLLFMSSTLSEQDLRRTFPGEEIVFTRAKPAAWVAGNKVFQIRTGTYSPETLLEHYSDWDVTGISKTGQHFFSGILAEIERDPNVKHAIITYRPLIRQLTAVAEKENVCFVRDFKALEKLEEAFEEIQVVWIVGIPIWEPGIIWRRTQILFGNDEKPLCYETEMDPRRYKDERVQSIYEQNVIGTLKGIIGRMGLNRWTDKKIVLVTSIELPDITDRPETLLFDWEDFEIAGGLDKLPEVIATRQRFEMERDNLTADSSRSEVERVLGCSARQANRVLQKIRGGNIPRVLFRDQLYALLSTGEKTTGELVASIEGHPTSVRNELKHLIDAGEIVKVRWGVYSLPSQVKH